MNKIKLILDKSACIGCGACVPEAWDSINNVSFIEEKSAVDFHIRNATQETEGNEELALNVNDEQFNNIKSAVDVCPVECLSTENLD